MHVGSNCSALRDSILGSVLYESNNTLSFYFSESRMKRRAREGKSDKGEGAGERQINEK